MRITQNKNQQRKEANECVIHSLKAQLNQKRQINVKSSNISRGQNWMHCAESFMQVF